jgi:threonine dehydrogenase-like Zn-dependent dehydrogenase
VRAYIKDLLPDILEGRIEPGRVFDRSVDLDGVPGAYRAMNDRESIKVLSPPSTRRPIFERRSRDSPPWS